MASSQPAGTGPFMGLLLHAASDATKVGDAAAWLLAHPESAAACAAAIKQSAERAPGFDAKVRHVQLLHEAFSGILGLGIHHPTCKALGPPLHSIAAPVLQAAHEAASEPAAVAQLRETVNLWAAHAAVPQQVLAACFDALQPRSPSLPQGLPQSLERVPVGVMVDMLKAAAAERGAQLYTPIQGVDPGLPAPSKEEASRITSCMREFRRLALGDTMASRRRAARREAAAAGAPPPAFGPEAYPPPIAVPRGPPRSAALSGSVTVPRRGRSDSEGGGSGGPRGGGRSSGRPHYSASSTPRTGLGAGPADASRARPSAPGGQEGDELSVRLDAFRRQHSSAYYSMVESNRQRRGRAS